ncbi:MAG: sugar phosphate isomerase/epimerase [Anaerolineaceae bacterium]|nr:sugar phosphate isomerase/epimerase [Anaerolineaceae bacterium]
MGKLFDTLAIQSYCFRVYDQTPDLINALKACGVSKVEVFPGHFDPTKNDNPQAYLDELAAGGIQMSAFGVIGIQDEASARKVFELAKLAGFSALSADFKLENLPLAEKLSEEYGIKLAIHNHGRHHRWGPVWALEELFSRSSANIGLCLDTAWMLDSGDDPVAVAKKFQDRLYGLHLKDFVFDRAGKPEDVVVGTGNLDLKGMMSFLKEINFGGYLTLEFEGDYEAPIPATKECVEAIRQVCAELA